MPVSLDCDLGMVLEQLAGKAIAQGKPEVALDFLRRAQVHLQDSPVTEQLLPLALLQRGQQELKDSRTLAALKTFEEAEEKAVTDRHLRVEARKGQVSAMVLESELRVERREFAGALEWAERAHKLERGPRTANAVATVHLNHAEAAARGGDWSTAQTEFLKARLRTPFRARADRRLRQVASAAERLVRINSMWWVRLPEVAGESEINGNLLYFDRSGAAVGWAPNGDTSRVVFTEAPAHVRPALFVLDRNRDGRFDELHMNSDNSRSTVLVDSDLDGYPDVRLHYVDGRLESREELSGRILFRVASAAIAEGFDAPWAGDIDPYFKLFVNNQFAMRSKTVDNTRWPRWDEGIVLQYRLGDTILLQLWMTTPRFGTTTSDRFSGKACPRRAL